MKDFLLILQIIVTASLVVLILLQSQGAGIGTIFGGGGGFYRSRRGVEKMFVYLTIALAVIFLILSLIQVVI